MATQAGEQSDAESACDSGRGVDAVILYGRDPRLGVCVHRGRRGGDATEDAARRW